MQLNTTLEVLGPVTLAPAQYTATVVEDRLLVRIGTLGRVQYHLKERLPNGETHTGLIQVTADGVISFLT